jgi:hypothetical protein
MLLLLLLIFSRECKRENRKRMLSEREEMIEKREEAKAASYRRIKVADTYFTRDKLVVLGNKQTNNEHYI